MEHEYAFAATDRDWYNYQKAHDFTDFINFWTPTVWKNTQLKPGHILVFLLTKTDPSIDTKEEFITALNKANKGRSSDSGCFVLKDVVFFDSPVKQSDYGLNIKRKPQGYIWGDGSFPFGQPILPSQADFELVPQTKKKKGQQSTTIREGQEQFHREISRAYGYRCCITGETAPELLQAAHIQDYINKDSNHIQNGLLLRIDIHKLFDSGLLYIDNHYKVHVSSLVKSKDYDKYNKKKIKLPKNKTQYPSKEALKFKEESFRK